jgi:membrane-associated phospholipid phosphatase
MYLFAVPALLLVLAVFYFTNQSHNLILVILFSLILLIVSFAVNFYIKCSGHASMTIFLSFLVLPVNFTAAILMLFCAIAIGWSRLELKRHTFAEVITGIFLGLAVGLPMLFFQGYFK